MKQLKFNDNLVPLIINGSKTVTWRLFDDKDLQVGDNVEFINAATKEKFADAILEDVRTKKISEIDENDKVGHESLGTGVELLKHYESLYKTPIKWNDPIKIIRFKLKTA